MSRTEAIRSAMKAIVDYERTLSAMLIDEVADIPGVQMRFAKTATPADPTKGRVLDHIGFDVKDLQGFIKKLEAAGIKMDRPYTPTDNGGALAFITDPWGTSIELNERPNPVYLP